MQSAIFAYTQTAPLDQGLFLVGGDAAQINTDQGRAMPGQDAPYARNNPQPFSAYLPAEQLFSAAWIPVTDVDDQGRVNPFPLFRVQALDRHHPATPLATTDLVLSNSRDLHCRECHAKGEIGARPDAHTPAAYHHSPEAHSWPGSVWPGTDPTRPEFFEAVDRAGQPSADPSDQEYAAVKNAISLHQFYD